MDLALSCGDGRMLVLIGPSGGGKTTLVRMLAGLSTPDEGRIDLSRSESWFDSARGINVTPQKRHTRLCLPGIYPLPAPEHLR